MINFSGRHFPKDVIIQGVRWYVAYSLSYRDIEELMQERGVSVDHATLNRWLIFTTRAYWKMNVISIINILWVPVGAWMKPTLKFTGNGAIYIVLLIKQERRLILCYPQPVINQRQNAFSKKH